MTGTLVHLKLRHRIMPMCTAQSTTRVTQLLRTLELWLMKYFFL
jgi:hypothetical protein